MIGWRNEWESVQTVQNVNVTISAEKKQWGKKKNVEQTFWFKIFNFMQFLQEVQIRDHLTKYRISLMLFLSLQTLDLYNERQFAQEHAHYCAT